MRGEADTELDPLKHPLAMFGLHRRTALLTGSSSGIGLALARGFLAAGARVVLNGRDPKKLLRAQQALEALAPASGMVSSHGFDVTDPDAIAVAVQALESKLGGIDILVNNAGVTFRAPLDTYSNAQWQQVMRTNLDSAFYVARAVVPGMKARGHGKIINMCSVLSESSRAGTAPYSASKGGLKMLTKGMAVDWARYGIQVNGIGPGYIQTEFTQALSGDPKFNDWLIDHTPAGRWGQVQDQVGAGIFLASDASAFVNGHVLYVDGGLTAAL